MASNGIENGGGKDTVMVDCYSLPSKQVESPAKPIRFEPKVRPRASKQAARRAAALSPNPKPKAEPVKGDEDEPRAPPPEDFGNGKEIKLEKLEIGEQTKAAENLVSGDVMKVENFGNESKMKVEVKVEEDEEKPVPPATAVKLESHLNESTDAGPNVEMREAGQDRVVREIDVYVSRSVDPSTQLYLLQYPLRPSWRPYELEELCQQVRVKAVQKKLEVDLAIDTDGANYDPDGEESHRIKTQTLSSSKTSLTTSYAIGVLRDNALHLNPLQAVVQLRPSMKHLDAADAEKKKQRGSAVDDGDEEMVIDGEATEAAAPGLVALQVNIRRRETEWQEANRLHSHAHLKQIDDAEPWIPLEPHGVDSPVTDGVRCKMKATTSSCSSLPFNLRGDEYVKRLVPSQEESNTEDEILSAGDGSGNAGGLSRSYLNRLPLEKRFHLLLSKGRVHVLQFDRLMNLAPQDSTEQEVLNVLREKAVLVQGCWVVASNLRYSKPVSTIRNYLLLLFTKRRIVQHSQLEGLQISKEILREILLSFAVQNGATASWEFQEDTDRSFIKRHQAVVREQSQLWMELEPSLLETVKHLELTASKGVGSPKIDLSTVKEISSAKNKHPAEGPTKAIPSPKSVHFVLGAGSSGQGSLSQATLAALPRALNKIFLKHNVCRLQFICQTLRQMAIVAVGGSSKALEEEAKAAAQAAAAPLPELEAAVSTVAANIDGVYFLNSLGSPSLDPFRNVVIALLKAKGPGSGLRKTDIMEASKIALKTQVPQATYQKVLKELCYTKGGAWVLKPGDGRPT